MDNVINWTIDSAHTVIGFKVKHMMISYVRGKFDKFDGTVSIDGDDLSTTKASLTIDVSSIDTNQPDRDKHLVSADFFDADKYKTITFASEKITKLDDEHYTLLGNLTIKDVSLPITLQVEAMGPVNDPFGNVRYGFTITGSLSRKAYGLLWNGLMPGGNQIISDDIYINCEAEIFHKA